MVQGDNLSLKPNCQRIEHGQYRKKQIYENHGAKSMCLLKDRQIKVLSLHFRGKEKAEIKRITKYPSSTVDYALKSGLQNIKKAIATTTLAVDKGLLTNQQMHQLRRLAEKLP